MSSESSSGTEEYAVLVFAKDIGIALFNSPISISSFSGIEPCLPASNEFFLAYFLDEVLLESEGLLGLSAGETGEYDCDGVEFRVKGRKPLEAEFAGDPARKVSGNEADMRFRVDVLAGLGIPDPSIADSWT